VKGHAHKICVYEDGSMYVEYATMEGAEYGHSHGIVRDDKGALVILADSGHTHVLAEGQPTLVVVDADAIVVVAARAPQPRRKGNSTTATQISTVGNVTATPSETSTMKTDAEKLADLQKSHDRLSLIVKLAPALFAHFNTLQSDAQDEFLAKSSTEREAIVVDVGKRRDEATKVVFVSKSTGEIYRASDDSRLVEMAKRDDARSAQLEKASFEKRAVDDMGNYPTSIGARALIIGSVLKSGAEQTLVDEAIEAVKAGDAALKLLAKGSGVNADGDPAPTDKQGAYTALAKGLSTFCAEKSIAKVWTEGLDAFVKTPAGAELQRAYDQASQ
jgi:hypothetical protein